MTTMELFILAPTEALPQGRVETMLGFYVDLTPRDYKSAASRK